jgi:hypothetical protein
MSKLDRRTVLTAAAGALVLGPGLIAAGRQERSTVRDRLWLWGHPAGSHTPGYGLPGRSTITPAEAAAYMDIPNLLMVRYGPSPQPPFEEYARPLAVLDRVVWSIEGGGGEDVDAALELTKVLPHLQGLIMDDYFGRITPPGGPMWLAANNVAFPVTLTLTFPQALAPDKLELVQSAWRTGDYLSKSFTVELAPEGERWSEAARGTLPPEAGATVAVPLPATPVRALRIRLLDTHDTDKALSCGLSQVRLWKGAESLLGPDAQVEASSEYPGHPARNVLPGAVAESPFSLKALQRLRQRLDALPRRLDLWVVLYTHEFDLPALREHLALCAVVTLWTWRAQDLAKLTESFARFEQVTGDRRKVLGCYMWDYGAGQPMPVAAMEAQCEQGLKWLREGRIEGMIFLASCICDLELDAVEWTRRWIAAHRDEKL